MIIVVFGLSRLLQIVRAGPGDLDGVKAVTQSPLFASTATPEADVIGLTLDYGTGCSTALFPNSSVSGTIDGDFFFTVNAVELYFSQIRVDGKTLTGRVAGGFAPASGAVTFAINIDVVLDDGLVVSGGATVVIEESAGTITISDATITVSGATTESFVVVFEDVLVNPGTHDNFVPESGTATFDLLDEDLESSLIPVAIEFTGRTPVDGTVYVTVDGGEPVEYTLSVESADPT